MIRNDQQRNFRTPSRTIPNAKKLHFVVIFIMTLACFGGCLSSKKVSRAEPSKTEKPRPETRPAAAPVAQNEDFDPTTLKAPEFRIARKPAARKSDTLNVATTMPAKVDTSWQTVPGYQVQLLQTEDAKLARSTVREAILALNVDVETIYEAPYYKIRAGRFVNRYDAEQLQNLASEKGYVNCWVVRTPVKVRANELLNQK